MIETSLKHLAHLCEGVLINSEEDFNVKGISIDSRNMNNANIFIPIKGDTYDGHGFIDHAFENGALVSLVSQNYDYSLFKSPLIVVKDTTKALQTLAKNYLKEINPKVVAVTGSNGKTSVKDITAALLSTKYKVLKTSGNFNNGIGLPLTILSATKDIEIAVLEMGMDHLGEIDLLSSIANPDIAIITSIGKAHLSELKTIDNIVKAKLEIANHLKPNGLLIVNGDSQLLMEHIQQNHYKQPVIPYGKKEHNDVVIKGISQFIDSLVFSIEAVSDTPIQTNLLGSFQAYNITAALIVAKAFGIEAHELKEALLQLQLSSNRTAILKVDKALIIDDTYKSNPESLLESLKFLSEYQNNGVKIAVLGDMLDLGPDTILYHQEISKHLNSLNIQRLYTFGELGKHFGDYASMVSEHFTSKDELFNSLKPWLSQDSTILFKASHSLDFTSLVNDLQATILRPTVGVIFGGKSSEYSVSLSSTYSLINHFPSQQYNPVLIAMDQQGRLFTGDFSAQEIVEDKYKQNLTCQEVILHPSKPSHLLELATNRSIKIDVIFNLIHGKYGEDGVLQALLKDKHFTYTGCDGQSSILCYDKDLTHRLLDLTNISKAKYQTLTSLITEEEYNALTSKLGSKVIIKPSREGSSYGISVAENFSEFYDGLFNALRFDSKVVIEEFIEGFEIGCSLLEKDGELIAGEIDEIELHTKFFDFDAKYAHKDAHIHCPARIESWQKQTTIETAKQVFQTLECQDYARVDFFIKKETGEVYFNEINTIPGFTSASRYPTMMSQVGISYTEVISTLIENALRRKNG